MAEEDIKPQHHFILSNHEGLVIRCCVQCGLSHQLSAHPRLYYPLWARMQEEKGDVSFSEVCPAENGSDISFPHHHFILSRHQRVIMRFCVRCGLTHYWTKDILASPYTQLWRRVREVERDVTIGEPCSADPESDAFKQRYEPIPHY